MHCKADAYAQHWSHEAMEPHVLAADQVDEGLLQRAPKRHRRLDCLLEILLRIRGSHEFHDVRIPALELLELIEHFLAGQRLACHVG